MKLTMFPLHQENAPLFQLTVLQVLQRKREKTAVEEELQFNMLISFKNHPEGLECFSYNVVNYTSEPAPRHFVEALKIVIADKHCRRTL